MALNLRSAITAVLPFILLIPSSGDAQIRLKISPEAGGQPTGDAEVCFHRHSPYDLSVLLQSPESRCLPARDVVEIPPDSQYSLFVRSPGLVSPNPVQFCPRTGHGGLLTIGAPLIPGSTLTFPSPDEGWIALAVHPDGERPPSILPLRKGRAVVPLGSRVTPLRILDGKVVGIGPTLLANQREEALDPLQWHSGLLVRVWPEGRLETSSPNSCEPPFNRDTISRLRAEAPPSLELTDARGRKHAPVNPAGTADLMIPSIFMFRDVAPGAARLRISGGNWIAREHELVVGQGVTVIPKPLEVERGAAAEVTPDGPAGRLLTSSSACAPADGAPSPRIEIRRCMDGSCEPVRSGDIVDASPLRFEGLPPGDYQVVALKGDHAVAETRVTLSPGTRGITLDEPLTHFVSGRVTRDGQPQQGSIRIRRTTTHTSADGEFAVVLPEAPGTSIAYFTSCDEQIFYGYRPTAAIMHGTVLEIAIPAHSVEVEVVDAENGDALPEADVILAVMKGESESASVVYQLPAIRENGMHSFGELDEGLPFRLCGEFQGYERTCSELYEKKRGREQLRLEMKPVAKRAGRVKAPGYSTIFWSLPDGRTTERAEIAGDGSFSYAKDHAPGEIITLVGSSPVIATLMPPVQGELEIVAQPVARRSVVVRLADTSPRANSLIALRLDGLRIPADALMAHQLMRRQSPMIVARRPMTIPDVGSARVAVDVGPDPQMLPRETQLGSPELFIGAPTFEVEGEEIVVP